MRTRTLSLAIGALILLVATWNIAVAQVPQPASVPPEIAEPSRPELLRRRTTLLQERGAVEQQVNQHNERCRSVVKGSSEETHCRASQSAVRSAIDRYAQSVREFNAEVASAALATQSRSFVATLSSDQERALGQAFLSEIDASGLVVTNPIITRYVGDIASRLAPHADLAFPITIRVVRDAEVNAYALPGGVVVLNTGLLEAVRSEEEVAAVMAHELAHVSQRHTVQATDAVANALGIGAALSGPLTALAAPIVRQAAAYKFERDQEREADRLAVETLYRAGFKPTGMVRLFERWRRSEGSSTAMERLFFTHPTSAERVQNAAPFLADPRFNTLREADGAAFAEMRRRLVGQ